MSAIGIDFGNDSCLIAVARQGRRGIEVLQNEIGKRNTTSLVAFAGKQRLVGADAEPNYQSNFKNSVVNFKQLIGRPFNQELADSEFKHNSYKVVADERGNAAVEVNYDGQQTVFTPEEISAAMFNKLKQVAESQGIRATDCVVAVPPFWTDGQRRSALEACRLAGLNVLSLINETTAVALNYGIIRPPPAEGHQHVLFVDVGHSATYASLAKFESGKVTMIATENAFNLGGRDFDQLLMDHFADYCAKKYKLDVWDNAKAVIKLRKECQRIKKFLSANKDAQFRIEYFIDEQDVAGEITRQEFEELAAPLLEGLKKLIDGVFARAGLTAAELHSCEIVGGASRIPCVQEVLKAHLGRELSKTCDGDESVAKGAALRCAMLSPIFRVRQYDILELNPYSVEIGWHFAEQPELDEKGQPKLDGRAELFESQCSLPTERSITFKPRTTPLTLLAAYKNPSDFPEGTDLRVAKFVVSGMPEELPSQEIPEEFKEMDIKLAKPKIKVYLSLDTHGLIGVTSAQVLTEVLEVEPAPAAAEPVKPAAAEANGEQMDTSEEAAAAVAAEPVSKPVPKKVKKRIPLKVTSEFVCSRSPEQYKMLEEREAAILAANAAAEALAAARNSLEAYVLEVRSKVRGEWAEFVDKETAEQFVDDLNNMEDWLYDDGEDAQKSEILAHLDTLRKTGDKIQHRWYEANNRQEAFQAYLNQLPTLTKWLEAQAVSRQENITDEDVAKVEDLLNSAQNWIVQSQATLAKHPSQQDPPITIDHIHKHQQETMAAARPIITRPVPKPKPEPAPQQQQQQPPPQPEPQPQPEQAEQDWELVDKEASEQAADDLNNMKDDVTAPADEASMDTSEE